jgi:hypothetical protein
LNGIPILKTKNASKSRERERERGKNREKAAPERRRKIEYPLKEKTAPKSGEKWTYCLTLAGRL